jgi:7-carboxy-7-deazaguanine synthase
MSGEIPVLEIFGPTIQGEGMVVGRKTMFVRTAGCDYSCSWCDSAFTWDGSAKDDIRLMTAEEIFEGLKENGGNRFDHVTVSGGNPALIKSLGSFIDLLKAHDIKVGLETQGSRWQDWFYKIDDLTISPKPPSSGMDTDFAILDSILDRLGKANRIPSNVSLKVVVFSEDDFEYVKKVHQRYQDVLLFLQVGNDDIETSDASRLTEKLLANYERLIEQVIQCDQLNAVKVLPQLHTLVWGNKRGV